MASATGVPENVSHQEEHEAREDEPLLGNAEQEEGKPIWHNLFLGTAVLTQAGAALLLLHIYITILLRRPYNLFTPHPLLNISGLLFLIQAILILQPTHTPSQKHTGTLIHSSFNALSLLLLLSGLIIILANKFSNSLAHFESPHAIMGVIFYILLAVQAVVGATQFYTPSLYGSVDNAKSIYKYHRVSGYLILILGLGTVLAATGTGYNVNVLGVKAWAVGVSGALVLVGMAPRVRKNKFGFGFLG